MNKVKLIADKVYDFYCPGCQQTHTVHTGGVRNGSGASWHFNGDLDRPTFKPSINLKTGKYADPNWQEPEEPGVWSTICHSFVTDGKIQFLHDCTHELRGREVALPDL